MVVVVKRKPPPRPSGRATGDKKKQSPKAKPVPLATQQMSEATKLAQFAIAPAKQDVKAAVAAAESRRLLDSRASEGIMKALAAFTSGDAEQARAGFADAADRVAGYAGGLTGAARGSFEASHLAAGELGRRLGATGEVVSQGDAVADTAYMTGGTIPGEQLASMAPAALLNAQGNRMAAGARLADNASLADFKSRGEISGIRAKLEELEAKRPGLIMDALKDIRQQANAKRATDTQIGYLQLQQAKTVQDRAIAMTNLTGTIHVVVGKGKAARVVDTRRVASGSDAVEIETRAATAAANAATAATAKTNVAKIQATAKRDAAKIQADAKVAAANITKRATLKKPPTPAQTSTIIKAASNVGITTLDTYVDQVWANTPGPSEKEVGATDPAYLKRKAAFQSRLAANWGTAMARVINAIGPQLKLLKYTPERIKAEARRIVSMEITPPIPGR